MDLEARSSTVHRITTNISQSIMYEVKSSRQIKYKPKNTDTKFRDCIAKQENDHVLGVALKVHSSTRSKQLVTFLNSISVSVDYSRVLRLETQLAEAVIKRMTLTNGIYIPPDLCNEGHLCFALDNIDFAEDTVDGKNTLHGTVLIAFLQGRLEGEKSR